jgi:hypothetical protein
MTMKKQSISWTKGSVKQRFEEASQTLRRLPNEIKLGHHTSRWPNIVYDKSEIIRQEKIELRLCAAPDAIDRLDETLAWGYWLSDIEIQIIWAKAERKTWKEISHECGVPKSTGDRYWNKGIIKIVNRLNIENTTT